MSNKSKDENKNTYWRDREEEHLRQNKLDEAEYDKRIRKIYGDMLQDVQKQINAFYGKYAAREGITLADAKKRISKADMKELERKAKRYVEDKEFSQEANERMRLYNATMRINRLEMLKSELGMALIDGHQELDEYMEKLLQGRTEDELKRMAGILGTTIRNNSQTAQNIVNASFHNATFSNRIWMHQDLLKADLDKLLQQGLIQGKNPRVLAKELEKRFAVTSTNAERLMRTELARVQTDAQVQSFIKNGFDEYTFNALQNALAPACDLCQPLDGKHFKIADMVIGENAPPIHPNCRCAISAYMDDAAYEAWLEHMANGGEEVDWQTFKNTGGMAAQSWLKVGNLPPSINEFDNYDDYVKAMREYQGDLRYSSDSEWNNSHVYSETEMENAKRFDATIMQLQKRFPLLDDGKLIIGDYELVQHHLHAIQKARVSSDAAAQFWRNPDTGVAVIGFRPNETTSSFMSDLKRRLKGIAEGKPLSDVFFNSPEGMAIHEYGHGISEYIMRAYSNGDEAAEEYWQWYKSLTKEDIENGLSKYAATNRAEFEAECFAELQTSNPRPLAQKYGEYLEKITKQKYNNSVSVDDTYAKQAKRKDTSQLKTIWLPKDEYAHIMSEIATNLTEREHQQFVVSKAIGDYIYTFENHGFGEYRIISKKPIDQEAEKWWDEE